MKKERKIERNGDLSVLLNDSLLSWYWLGFITADGTFNVEKGRMRFRLAQKDLDVLKSFGSFVSYTKDVYNGINIQDKKVVGELVKRFNFVNQKTYNPITLDRPVDFKKMAFYIGLIDGDGCVQQVHNRKDCAITIKMHSSWLLFLSQMEKDIYEFFHLDKRKDGNLTKIESRGYAKVSFTDMRIVKGLKRFVLDNDLLIMKRKWDLIDHNKIGRMENADKLRVEISALRMGGLSYRSIGKKLKMNHGKVHALVNGRKK